MKDRLSELIDLLEGCIGSGELLNISDQELKEIRDILRLVRMEREAADAVQQLPPRPARSAW